MCSLIFSIVYHAIQINRLGKIELHCSTMRMLINEVHDIWQKQFVQGSTGLRSSLHNFKKTNSPKLLSTCKTRISYEKYIVGRVVSICSLMF